MTYFYVPGMTGQRYSGALLQASSKVLSNVFESQFIVGVAVVLLFVFLNLAPLVTFATRIDVGIGFQT